MKNDLNRILSKERHLSLQDLTIRYGLNCFSYQTSQFVEEVKSVLTFQDHDIFYDLGCGYGEVLNNFAIVYPNVKFVGIEIVKERFLTARGILKNNKSSNIELRNQDMLQANFDDGTIFYVFNPLFNFQYPILIKKLKRISIKHPITVIAEAKACLYFDKLSWLRKLSTFHKDTINVSKIYTSFS